jgi:hypothetical protein
MWRPKFADDAMKKLTDAPQQAIAISIVALVFAVAAILMSRQKAA